MDNQSAPYFDFEKVKMIIPEKFNVQKVVCREIDVSFYKDSKNESTSSKLESTRSLSQGHFVPKENAVRSKHYLLKITFKWKRGITAENTS